MHYEAESLCRLPPPFGRTGEEDYPSTIAEPKKVRGQHYDIVLNVNELGVRKRILASINPMYTRKIFEEVLQIPSEVVESFFGYMLLNPSNMVFPRMVASRWDLIDWSPYWLVRKVFMSVDCFSQNAKDLMTDSPGNATDRQLRIQDSVDRRGKLTLEIPPFPGQISRYPSSFPNLSFLCLLESASCRC